MMRFDCKLKMRLLLSIGLLVLHAANSIAAANDGATVFRHDNMMGRPNITAALGNPDLMAQFWRNSIRATTQSINAFSQKMFEAVMKNTPNSLTWSPAAVSMILSMLSFGTSGERTIDIRKALLFPNDTDEAKLGFAILAKQAAGKDILLNVANKIFYSDRMSFNSEFMYIVKKVFRSEADSTALDKPMQASWTMNKWCEKKTNRRIRNVMHRDDIGAQTFIVLLSAAYFKGTWLKQFDETEELPFYVGGGQEKEVTAMSVEGNFRFGILPELRSRFVELPYKTKHDNQTVSMFIILPNSQDGLDNLEKNFAGVTVEELIRRGGPTNVKIVLPQFKIESKINLNKPLASMGMKNTLEYTYFNRTSRRYLTVDIIKVVQKMMIEVDDLGSEPAIPLDANRPKSNEWFIALHPFIAVIATKDESPVTLAVARYKGPQ